MADIKGGKSCWGACLAVFAAVGTWVLYPALSLGQQGYGTSHIIAQAVNPEGIEITTIEGVSTESVEFFDGDTFIGYGAGPEECGTWISLPAGVHTIRATFNGMTRRKDVYLPADEVTVVTFVFERKEVDLVSHLNSISVSGAVQLSGAFACRESRSKPHFDGTSDRMEAWIEGTGVHYALAANTNASGRPVADAFEYQGDMRVTLNAQEFVWSGCGRVALTEACTTNPWYSGDYFTHMAVRTTVLLEDLSTLMKVTPGFSSWYIQGNMTGDYPHLVVSKRGRADRPDWPYWDRVHVVDLHDTTLIEVPNEETYTVHWSELGQEGASGHVSITDWGPKEWVLERYGTLENLKLSSVPYDVAGTGVKCQGVRAPVASFTYEPESPVVGQEIVFDASSSTDPDGEIVNCYWDLGDGTPLLGQVVKHTYTAPGEYTVTLIVEDDSGLTDSTDETFRMNRLNRYDGNEFVSVSEDDIEAGYVDPARVTVVLVHGWNRDRHLSLNKPRRIWTELAEAISQRSPGTNILAWDWMYEARSSTPVSPLPATNKVRTQGRLLADALEALFSEHLTGRPAFHLLGHSLGAAVVSHCAASTVLNIRRVTLWDAPENWLAHCSGGKVYLDPVVSQLAARMIAVDSYYSAYGEPYRDATQNVDLRVAAELVYGLRSAGAVFGGPQHGYPMEWYLETILNPTFSQLYRVELGWIWRAFPMDGRYAGWPWSRACNGAYPASEGHWFSLFCLGREEVGRALYPVDPEWGPATSVSTPIAEVDLATDEWDTFGNVSQIPNGIQLAEGSSASVSRSLDIPEEADGFDFEYLFTEAGDGDFLALYCDGVLLWSAIGADFDGDDYVTTPFVNVSFAQGQTVEIKLVLESMGDVNAVARLKNLRLLALVPPEQQYLEVVVWGDGTAVPETGLYDFNSTVHLVASANDGWEFVGWHGVDAQDANTASVAIDRNRMVVAEFAEIAPDGDGQGDGGCVTAGALASLGVCGGLLLLVRSRRAGHKDGL